MLKLLLIALVLLFCMACNDGTLAEPDAKAAYDLWQSKNIHNYSIDQVYSCFCVNRGQTVRITVRADTILNLVNISGDSVIYSAGYFTIDSLFGIINHSEYDSLVIRYNAKYGYPEFLDINPQDHPADGGVLYVTSNLQIQ